MGKLLWWRKRRVIYDLDFKLEALRRMQDEGLSCRQAAALFNIRRLDLVAEWSRLYAAHGATAFHLDIERVTRRSKRDIKILSRGRIWMRTSQRRQFDVAAEREA